MGMQQKTITQKHYDYIKHTWVRLRVDRGMKQQHLTVKGIGTISHDGASQKHFRQILEECVLLSSTPPDE